MNTSLPSHIRFSLAPPGPESSQANFLNTLEDCIMTANGNTGLFEALVEVQVYRLAKREPGAFPELFAEQGKPSSNRVLAPLPQKRVQGQRYGDQPTASLTKARFPTPFIDQTHVGDTLPTAAKKAILSYIDYLIIKYQKRRSKADPVQLPPLVLAGRMHTLYRVNFDPASMSSSRLEQRLFHHLGSQHRGPTRDEAEEML